MKCFSVYEHGHCLCMKSSFHYFSKSSFRERPSGLSRAGILWFLLAVEPHAADCAPQSPKQQTSNLGSNTQNFLCQWLPGSSNTKQHLLGVNNSLLGPEDPCWALVFTCQWLPSRLWQSVLGGSIWGQLLSQNCQEAHNCLSNHSDFKWTSFLKKTSGEAFFFKNL